MKYDRNNKEEMLVALSEVVSDSACSYNKFSLRKMLNRNWQLDARSPGMLKIVCYDKNAPGCKSVIKFDIVVETPQGKMFGMRLKENSNQSSEPKVSVQEVGISMIEAECKVEDRSQKNDRI